MYFILIQEELGQKFMFQNVTNSSQTLSMMHLQSSTLYETDSQEQDSQIFAAMPAIRGLSK